MGAPQISWRVLTPIACSSMILPCLADENGFLNVFKVGDEVQDNAFVAEVLLCEWSLTHGERGERWTCKSPRAKQ